MEQLLSIGTAKQKERLVKKKLEQQQYEFVGQHSACKVCAWTKKDLKDEGHCYKGKFYGINSHRCVQMTPTQTCNHACTFCWRDLDSHTAILMSEKIDEPKDIVDGCIKSQIKQLTGFGGNIRANQEKWENSKDPMHFAISLNGEPTIYPKIGELVKEINSRGMSSYLVTNGTFPKKIKKMFDNNQLPTQFYVSVDAPNKQLFNEIDRPLIPDCWDKLMETLQFLPKLKEKTRTVLRYTLLKNINMIYPEQWADIIILSQPLFVEIKGYMFVGSSRQRLKIENMPRHHEVKAFALEICKYSGYKLIDEHEQSRVVLLMKEDFEGRILNFKIMMQQGL
ncbi:4-demethylwyosine synthase TYW1 [Candidatus Woesearchaeota archaeon]|nr:4-demethylwyosine synthase TYW1 [Candidatus Woesearchaeota archaeon]